MSEETAPYGTGVSRPEAPQIKRVDEDVLVFEYGYGSAKDHAGKRVFIVGSATSGACFAYSQSTRGADC